MQTRNSARILLCFLALCLCLSSNVVAAQNDLDDAMIAEELRALSTAINSLAQQMETQAAGASKDITLRKLDIAIAYLNFRSRRIEMFERDLQTARTSRNRLDDLQEQFQNEEENLSQSFDSSQKDAMQRAREEMQFRQRALKDRINRLDEQIILLENRTMDMQSQIDSVESFVQKNLDF